MIFLKTLRNRFEIINELITFLWIKKMWWLIPLIIILLLFGFIMFLAQNPYIAPFVYPLI
jgi:hypothetical protein